MITEPQELVIPFAKSPKPIEIVVSYEWEKDDEHNVRPTAQHPAWIFLRERANQVINEVKKRAESRPGGIALQIRLNRLRGRHGMTLLDTLNDRVGRADVMICDLQAPGSDTPNHNVLIELGMGLQAGLARSGGLFVFSRKGTKVPTDLQGIVLSEYSVDARNKRTILDQRGFTAALRTRLMDIARERGMIRTAGKPVLETDE